VAHLAQNRLLPLLVEAAAQQPAIDLRMGHAIHSFTQTAEGVTAVVDASPDGNGGGGNIYRLPSELGGWLVGEGCRRALCDRVAA
jgi:hypothetical protein